MTGKINLNDFLYKDSAVDAGLQKRLRLAEEINNEIGFPLDQREALELACRLILISIGEDITREGLKETPARFGRMWREFIDYDPGSVDTSFESTSANQMVVVSGMQVWSMCEHHLLPFSAEVSIGYIPRGRVLGLSKFGRIAHQFAHKLQVQEQLAEQIAEAVMKVTGSPDVAVLIRGSHTCMTMRGIRTPSLMTTSVVRGVFHDEISARAEFLDLCRR